MVFRHGTPLHLQVAEKARTLVLNVGPGARLPSDGKLAVRWKVSVRTIREALLLLEAEGRVKRRRGSGTWVCEPPHRPVALFSELNLLHPTTPRFFGLVFNVVRQRLLDAGYTSRLYTGRSKAGDEPGFSCPELIDDAESSELAGILSMTSSLQEPRLKTLRSTGLPMVELTCTSPFGGTFGMHRIPEVAVPYLAQVGRRKIAMIGWDHPSGDVAPTLIPAFRKAIEAQDADFHPEWCRVENSFAWNGSAWEGFREIWFAREGKPDALLVTDENFLPEVIMAILQLRIEIPRDLLVVSHQTESVNWSLPAPVARIEYDATTFSNCLADQMLAALRSESPPTLPTDLQPYRLYPLPGSTARNVPPTNPRRIPTP